ncbi:hypothetical protein CSA37_02145 [Candidatus Fermentibacteria bacterium]|nr:MAG: hypothetical protein CSA37_02145 [Candidatus Fermentibacteria bacterium]
MRITDNDVWDILSVLVDTATRDMRVVPCESVDIVARFCNMGTGRRRPIRVGIYDTSVYPEREIATSTIGFLPYGSGFYREDEYIQVIFNWDSITTAGIGVHIL